MATIDKLTQRKWESCLNYIRDNVSEEQFATWFGPIRLLAYVEEEKKITLGIPNDFFREYLEGNFVTVYSRALIKNFGPGVHLYFQILVDKEHIVPGAGETNITSINPNAVSKKPAFDSQLNPSLRFENFVEGESNKLPCTVGRAIAEHPDQGTFNPLFVYGPSGVGKTHLVNAIGLRISELYPDQKVLFVSAHTFMVQFTNSKIKNSTNDFIAFYQGINTLIIDDIQELAGMKATLNAFFHIFNHLKQNGRQIILTSDRMPSELQGMEDRMLTRFNWGLTAEIQKPDKAMRQAILEEKVQHEGLKIPRNVIEYVAENVCDSVRDLEGVVNSLIAHSIVYNRDIDLNLAERVLHHAVRLDKKPITLDEIVQHTCSFLKISEKDIYGRCRKANIVLGRQTVMFLAQKLTNLSISRIGTLVGDRNHATVIHSINTINDKIDVDQKFSETLSELEESIRQHKHLE